ncbi:Capsular polysaccharide synthesis [Penicillium macrosclerotiorum]|uniref:Capsular polysaccharide synthesis n=1 Tax=Penicillium macrosclerotiorum TaxID=303699 RepID=UPI002548315A|nr:Capsular polysaccharide synthesis [Penicillium macrosclerotiorum]KAJ5669443.1 Capsular polysaccharide synthesis [Penicillium macrosclerotiorum]
MEYPLPPGMHVIPSQVLDMRSDVDIDFDLMHPPPVTGTKNVWFFWHSGYETMHPYTQRNVRAWHRRFSKQGWTVRVMDRRPGSKSNIANFLNVTDHTTFPRAFIDENLTGYYALQHTSDLVRWPLLLRYGGVYADVGLMQIGDLDKLWNETIANPDSPYEVLSYTDTSENYYSLTNYFLAAMPDNALFERCHRLLLTLWAADGGKTSTDGMHASPLLRGTTLMGGAFTITEEDGTFIGPEEVSRMLTDYIIQGQVATAVMGLVDPESNWDGPKYCVEHFYAIDFMEGSQLINELTSWDGQKAFDLMSLSMPKEKEEGESEAQSKAREIVEACLSRSYGFKLAHGLILRVNKVTLGSLWRDNPGSDIVPGTYGAWLRHGIAYWNQDAVPARVNLPLIPPTKVGRLLQDTA